MNTGERLAWYREAKFGLFVHWGPYSVAGVEASWPIMAPELAAAMFGTQIRISEEEYRALPRSFNPEKFDADTWVKTAQDAGMRYMIFTSKHHDGFCMFDAPGTEYKITNTPFGRDVCLELAEACARQGLRLGFYYSPPDMHHPGYRDTAKPAYKNWLGEPQRPEWGEYLDYMEEHLRKLLTGYGDVSVLWFDGLMNHAKYDPPRFRKLIQEMSPGTLVNDRLGREYDFITPEQYIPRHGVPVRNPDHPAAAASGEGLFKVIGMTLKIPIVKHLVFRSLRKYGEGEIDLAKIAVSSFPGETEFQPWETCMTMNRTWGYNPRDDEWKSPEKLLNNLIEVASGGGNLLLNVGPAPDGTFPPQAVERMEAIGGWLSANGEAVYGTTYGSRQAIGGIPVTCAGETVYLHLPLHTRVQAAQAHEGLLRLDGFAELIPPGFTITGIYAVRDNSEIPYNLEGGTLTITIPRERVASRPHPSYPYTMAVRCTSA